VNEIRHVDRIVAFRTLNALADHYSIVANNDYPLASHLKSARERAPAEFDDRLLLALDRKQLLPADFESSTRDFPELYPLIQRTGRLLASNPGYQSHTDLSGIAVDGRDSQGRRLLFLSFTGGQLSNDHYPYYEMFFREPPAASAFTLVRSQHYFYDASGMEGFEWYVIWMFIAAPGIALGALLFGIIRAVVLHREEAKHLEPA
jgi:hypothetical protein